MKKILLLTLPLIVMCFASCEKGKGEHSEDNIIQFEDSHFLHALLSVQEIEIYDGDDWINYMVDVDTNRDGQISVNEAKIVRGLDLFNFNVQSMPEIKYFTSLTYLYCTHNQLTSLDVSNNTALAYLECDNNQLTSIDISSNTALQTLDCDDNQLASLDLSNNTALEYLFCSHNQLTSLDLSNNTVLTHLECNNNQLETLIISESQRNASWLGGVRNLYPDIEIIVK